MIFSELANAQQHRVHISCTEFNTTCITNKLHEAESFLRNSLNFIEPKVHHHIHKRPSPVPTLGQSNQSMPPHPISWISILILSYLRVGLSVGFFFPLKSSHQNSMCTFLSPIHATCLAHLFFAI